MHVSRICFYIRDSLCRDVLKTWRAAIDLKLWGSARVKVDDFIIRKNARARDLRENRAERDFCIQHTDSVAELPERRKKKKGERAQRRRRRGRRETIFRSYRQLGYEVAQFATAQFSTGADKIRAGTHGHLPRE